MVDVVTVGSATVDVFIETDDARVVSVSTKEFSHDFMAYPYGSKLEIDNFTSQCGGGGVNTGMNFSHLGLDTSIMCKVGSDYFADWIEEAFRKHNVNTESIIKSSDFYTGFSIILTSFEGDRTVLAHRGANAQMTLDDINWDVVKNAKWLYLAPLNGETSKILDKLAEFAEQNNTNLAINLGTTSIKMNKADLAKVLETAEIIIMNKEEAVMLSGINIRPNSKTEKFDNEFIHPDLKQIMVQLQNISRQIVLITDGKRGVYAYDGDKYYKCPEFPADVVSTLGAGDAFASTFTATIEKYGKDVSRALKYASVNAASVVSNFGAQEGFLTFAEIEEKLRQNPDFQVATLDAD